MLNFRFVLVIACLRMPWVVKGENYYVVSSVSAQHSFFFSYVEELIKRIPNKTLSILFHLRDVAYVSEYRARLLLLILLIEIFCLTGNAQERVDGEAVPFGDEIRLDKESVPGQCIRWYQEFLSAHKNSMCPMYPSCSNYGLMLFNGLPFWKAMVLTADRMIRCSHDRKFYTVTHAYGYSSLLDYPVGKTLPVPIVLESKLHPHAISLKGGLGKDSLEMFVNYLINNKRYQEGLWEIDRALFFGISGKENLYVAKLMCYEGMGKEAQGVYEYETLFPDSVRQYAPVAFAAARLYDRMENEEDALRLLDLAGKKCGNALSWKRVEALRGIAEAKRGNVSRADSMFWKIEKSSSDGRIGRLSREILLDMSKSKRKNPALARLLSVFPGAGYWYTGHNGSAVASLVINALLMYSTYTSIRSKNYGVASLCGFLSLTFYIGNIKGAGRSARRYNERMRDIGIRRLYDVNNSLIY